MQGKSKISVSYVNFKMPIKQKIDDVSQAVKNMSLEIRGEMLTGNINMGIANI